MEDLRTRIKALMREIEFTHLKKIWVEHAIEDGVDERDAYRWSAEIGHVVDEYERSLRFLVDLLESRSKERIARKLESWAAYTRDISAWKLADVTVQLLDERLKQYLPPEPDDEDESL